MEKVSNEEFQQNERESKVDHEQKVEPDKITPHSLRSKGKNKTGNKVFEGNNIRLSKKRSCTEKMEIIKAATTHSQNADKYKDDNVNCDLDNKKNVRNEKDYQE